MDREKRRSQEEEAELDRKIALIREKNLKYEQRLKEIEEDRLLNDVPMTKSPQTTEEKPKASRENGKWSREWDKGKTPVETWRENVPPIDLKGKLASGKPKTPRGTKKNEKTENSTPQKNSSRLEGRLSSKEETPTPETDVKPKNANRRRNDGRREKKAVAGSDLVIEIKNDRQAEHKQGDGEKQKKNRRHKKESDNYAVKKVVRSIVDRVIKIDKREKRLQEKKESELKTVEEPKPAAEEVEKKPEASAVVSDSNQNVITLVKEKVAEVVITTNAQ